MEDVTSVSYEFNPFRAPTTYTHAGLTTIEMYAPKEAKKGVDKDNVGMVVHYEISDSLENYVQESGRAGRDESINAECYILFNEDDLGKHFIMLNQTKQKTGSKQPNMAQSMTKQMTYFMPIITVFIGASLPAGLTFYWFLITILGAAQQQLVFKKMEQAEVTSN